MKVLLLNRSYYPHIGGIENSLYYLSREYKRLGHRVIILTEKISDNHPYRKEFADIITFPRRPVNDLLLPILPIVYRKRITKWIQEHKYQVKADIIICRDPMLGLAYQEVFPKASITYIPAVVIKFYNKGIRKANSFQESIKEILRYFQLKIEENQQKTILNLSKKVVVFSENVKKQLIDCRLCEKGKISVCYPGIADNIMANKNRYYVNNSSVNFVFVGRLVAEKNIKMLIDAFNQLQYKNKKLTLVGDGNQRQELEKYVRKLSLEDSVIFVGATNTPEKYYQEAHFFVIPSSYESFGQVIIEALSNAIPVIGFATIKGKTLTAIDELVEDGVTGFVCRDFNSDSLKINMEKAINIIDDTEKYYFMKNKAQQFVIKNCSWTNLAKLCIDNKL